MQLLARTPARAGHALLEGEEAVRHIFGQRERDEEADHVEAPARRPSGSARRKASTTAPYASTPTAIAPASINSSWKRPAANVCASIAPPQAPAPAAMAANNTGRTASRKRLSTDSSARLCPTMVRIATFSHAPSAVPSATPAIPR